jgi:hypothetical protein
MDNEQSDLVENVENVEKINIEDDVYSDGEPRNRCIECNIDMGQSNPRQLCKKYRCTSE